jgi:hypothetical protein
MWPQRPASGLLASLTEMGLNAAPGIVDGGLVVGVVTLAKRLRGKLPAS